jgi:hypothetical protein
MPSMYTKISRWFFLVPVIYAGFIGYLLYMQFSGEVSKKDRVNHVSLVAEMAAGSGKSPGRISSMEVSANGLTFSFSKNSPVIIETVSQGTIEKTATAYSIDTNMVNIEFGDDFGLRIDVSDDGSQDVAIRTESMPEDAVKVTVPFSISEGYVSSRLKNIPAMIINKTESVNSDHTLAFLPLLSFIEPEPLRFVLTKRDGSFGTIQLTSDKSALADPFENWISEHFKFETAANYKQIKASFEEKAYQGWISGRYDRLRGTWNMPDGTKKFDESIMALLLAESLARGTYDSGLATMQSARAQHNNLTTHLTAPFLGDIIIKGNQIDQKEAAAVERIGIQLDQKDAAVFSAFNLPSFAVDRTPFLVAQGLSDLAAEIETRDLDLATGIGMVQAYADSLSFSGDTFQSFKNFRPIVENIILPSLFFSDEGLFLKTDETTCNVFLSLQAGDLLRRIGENEKNITLASIGRELTASAIIRADESGYLPEKINIDGTRIEDGPLLIRPEEIHHFVSESIYAPREISLFALAGPGTWLWTIADQVKVTKENKTYRISLNFPVGKTHHLLIKGIGPLSSLTLYGQQWRNDPRFQEYGSGWFYDANTRSLYIKLAHRTNTEVITIQQP